VAAGAVPARSVAAGPQAESPERVRVAASERYKAGRIHRFALGGGYRDLWEAKIELPVLDLATEAGGLTPAGRYGGLQTAVLSFKGKDGRSYTFRGTDKDPSAVLDPMLQGTVVEKFVQDQMAAQHPAGPVAAAVLTRAAGVLTYGGRLVVMPDDPALGEYREEFAGMVGLFFEYPQPKSEENPGFEGATEILNHKKLYERLAAGNEVEVDAEAFLRARLMDLLLGDFDRHRKQWRWAKIPGHAKLQPIPEDRDQAFVRYSGAGPGLGRIYIPILQKYGPRYPVIKGLTLHGWEQDRWLLAGLGWEQWERIATDIQARITDDVIDRAVAALPPEYVALDAERLRGDIRGRRNRLLKAARRFYLYLAHEVDIQTSDAADVVTVRKMPGGKMQVEVREHAAGGQPGRQVYARTFDPRHTGDVRIYLRGGDDHVRIESKPARIRLRVIAEGGNKSIDNRVGLSTRFYDEKGAFKKIHGKRTRVIEKPYEPPEPDAGFVDVEDVPPRDWRSDTIPLPQFGYQPDAGVFLGMAVTHIQYGFRRHPWASKHTISGGWAFEAMQPLARYQGLFRPENSKVLLGLDLQYSGIEILRYFGLGNETRFDREDSFYRVRNQQMRAIPSVSGRVWKDRVRLSAGPYLGFSRTVSGDRLVDSEDPYGSGHFGLMGLVGNVQLDTRKTLQTGPQDLVLGHPDNVAAGYPTSGILIDATGRFSPPVWDVDTTYGAILGSIAGYLSAGKGAEVTAAARVGGKRTFGKTPYFDLAYIGGGRFFSGSATNRGFRPQRFAGHSSLYANADVRMLVARFKLVVPGDFGVHGFGDVGRVFARGKTSNRWHGSYGGGLWFSPLVRANTLSLSLARSREDLLVYFRLGFLY
jgi:hypothetical protein